MLICQCDFSLDFSIFVIFSRDAGREFGGQPKLMKPRSRGKWLPFERAREAVVVMIGVCRFSTGGRGLVGNFRVKANTITVCMYNQ